MPFAVTRTAMLQNLRRLMVESDQNIGERFVVAHQDIEARTKSLDEIGFEQQRFRLGVDENELHRRRL